MPYVSIAADKMFAAVLSLDKMEVFKEKCPKKRLRVVKTSPLVKGVSSESVPPCRIGSSAGQYWMAGWA
jgi:hypothetical protein